MAKFKISQERNKCIGCGACEAICPDNWEMKDDNKATPKKTELEELGCNKDAAEHCPVTIIHIKDVQKDKELI